METTISSTEELKKLAEQLITQLPKGSIVALFGDLGAGKTTFVSYAVAAYGLDVRVQSPTFVLNRVYSNEYVRVNHYDLYRISTVAEVLDLGLLEEIDDSTVTFVEWPQLIMDLLPKQNLYTLHFDILGEEKRKVVFSKVL